VVLRLDDSVGCAALARDVTRKVQSVFVISFRNVLLSRWSFWKHLQVNEFSLVVFHDDGLFTVELEVTGR
jgi:hypothetical protein